MKSLQRLVIACTALVLCWHPVSAQTARAPHVTTQYFGQKPANAPMLRPSKSNYAYQIVFHGGLPAVRVGIDKFNGTIIQDRAEIAPGVQLRIPDQKKWLNGEPEPAPMISANGRPISVDFGKFLSDASLWTHEVLNDSTYQLGRGFFKKDAYWYFGLVKANGKTYVGVCWFSLGSIESDTVALVLRLDWNGSTLLPTPVKALPTIPTSAEFPLALDTLSDGNLVVSGGGALLEMNTKGEWTETPSPSTLLRSNARLAAYSAYWRRGPWLLTYHQEYLGEGATTRIHIVVQEEATRKKVEAFTWIVPTQ